MKLKYLLLLGWLCALISCTDNYEVLKGEIKGEYTGIFTRKGRIVSVELSFSENSFSGKSERAKFPAIGNGNYSVVEDTIYFENANLWTTDFDGTLILSNKWIYTLESNKYLTLEKENGDKYILQKYE